MRTGLRVIDAMTKEPVTVTPDTSVFECAKKMKKEHLGSVIVQDKERLAGIISEQDLVHKIIASGVSSKKTPVKEIMTTDVVTITPDKDITDAMLKMSALNVRRLPVTEGAQLVGVLTMKDILKVEPQLFELIVDKIQLREEKLKPINRVGDYASFLFEQDDSLVCKDCREE